MIHKEIISLYTQKYLHHVEKTTATLNWIGKIS